MALVVGHQSHEARAPPRRAAAGPHGRRRRCPTRWSWPEACPIGSRLERMTARHAAARHVGCHLVLDVGATGRVAGAAGGAGPPASAVGVRAARRASRRARRSQPTRSCRRGAARRSLPPRDGAGGGRSRCDYEASRAARAASAGPPAGLRRLRPRRPSPTSARAATARPTALLAFATAELGHLPRRSGAGRRRSRTGCSSGSPTTSTPAGRSTAPSTRCCRRRGRVPRLRPPHGGAVPGPRDPGPAGGRLRPGPVADGLPRRRRGAVDGRVAGARRHPAGAPRLAGAHRHRPRRRRHRLRHHPPRRRRAR